jgi:hypothetical protein
LIYRACLDLAEEHNRRSVAFPSISTGVYNFPVRRAAKIAVAEIWAFLNQNERVEKVLSDSPGLPQGSKYWSSRTPSASTRTKSSPGVVVCAPGSPKARPDRWLADWKKRQKK